MEPLTAPEFARGVRLDAIGEGTRALAIEADGAERAALARRFGLLALDRLVATAELRRAGAQVIAAGELEADVTQACVASGAEVRAHVAAPFALRFVPAAEATPDEEVELDAGQLDEVAYDGAAIDLGEAVAQTLALALDPFPRAAGAEEALRAAGVVSEDDDETGPFAGLKALRDRLAGG